MRAAELAVALLILAAAAGSPRTQSPVSVRLHHFHYRTPHVSAALADVVGLHSGARVLLQGLGVGVKVGNEYVLFDRGSVPIETETPAPDSSLEKRQFNEALDCYRAAEQWLREHGVSVASTDLGSAKAASAVHNATLDHVAFASGNPDSVGEMLRAAGALEERRTTDSVFFRARGEVIEITRETDLPDVLWCPMHPDVRAAAPGKCPICAMDLVPIPPPRLGQYRMDVIQVPSRTAKGSTGLTLIIRDPQSGEPVTGFTPLHERLLHLFLISRDLRFFAHEHPVQNGNRFNLAVDLSPGAYMLVADFLPAGGSPQMVHRAIVTPGFAASPFAPPADLAEDSGEKLADGLRVRLTVQSRLDRPAAVLRFTFTDATSGAAVSDLQPYLGASGHLLIVNADLTQSVHAHPDASTSGPEVAFAAEFPAAGLYKLWVQVQRGGKVVTAPFVVRIGG